MVLDLWFPPNFMHLASIVPANLKGTLHWLQIRTHWESIEAITYSLGVIVYKKKIVPIVNIIIFQEYM